MSTVYADQMLRLFGGFPCSECLAVEPLGLIAPTPLLHCSAPLLVVWRICIALDDRGSRCYAAPRHVPHDRDRSREEDDDLSQHAACERLRACVFQAAAFGLHTARERLRACVFMAAAIRMHDAHERLRACHCSE